MVFFSRGKDDGELKEETTKGDGGVLFYHSDIYNLKQK